MSKEAPRVREEEAARWLLDLKKNNKNGLKPLLAAKWMMDRDDMAKWLVENFFVNVAPLFGFQISSFYIVEIIKLVRI